MSRSRSSSHSRPPRLIPDVQVTVVPFVDAEEAWFWFMHSQRSRLEGGSFHDAGGAVARPCDPDDIYRAVMGLVRRRLIGQTHLKVLAHFGYIDCPPDNRIREQARAHDLWSEALDRLTTVLKGKGIVDVE